MRALHRAFDFLGQHAMLFILAGRRSLRSA